MEDYCLDARMTVEGALRLSESSRVAECQTMAVERQLQASCALPDVATEAQDTSRQERQAVSDLLRQTCTLLDQAEYYKQALPALETVMGKVETSALTILNDLTEAAAENVTDSSTDQVATSADAETSEPATAEAPDNTASSAATPPASGGKANANANANANAVGKKGGSKAPGPAS